ncbi:NAD dependent epimerase/dehydratase family protein [Stieleria maiorica]|uniref:NAD dependent epimerase/dehydratase family protein n=1 Tax=Stieleria maiorica TaxID=2795974 RepID=A0A5B9ML43_9BACT|nr:NAD-dependent epimerase/dehydratase family protein [Stieleria maiorica]QEG01160.1 NAD dependent epimerase/dehydratase family protein [Stieleria maiorica]
MNDNTDVLVVGAGYLGQIVAKLSASAAAGTSAKVYATTRHQNRFAELAGNGFHPIRFDWTDQATFPNLPWRQLSAAPRVLVAVSYDRNSPLDRYQSQVGGLRSLLRVLPTDARLCYISTTGVYHQTDGRWVDETSPTHPTRLGGRVHLQAESLLHALRPAAPWAVLRLAGIYGPGRVPRAADVIAGRPIASPESGFLNLIHVQDAARAVLAAWEKMATASGGPVVSMQSRLYAVSDDAPVMRADFYREIARRCGAPAPRFVAPPPHASDRMRSDSNKRVWNRKLRRELLPALDFPDYRCGLADVLRPPVE